MPVRRTCLERFAGAIRRDGRQDDVHLVGGLSEGAGRRGCQPGKRTHAGLPRRGCAHLEKCLLRRNPAQVRRNPHRDEVLGVHSTDGRTLDLQRDVLGREQCARHTPGPEEGRSKSGAILQGPRSAMGTTSSGSAPASDTAAGATPHRRATPPAAGSAPGASRARGAPSPSTAFRPREAARSPNPPS